MVLASHEQQFVRQAFLRKDPVPTVRDVVQALLIARVSGGVEVWPPMIVLEEAEELNRLVQDMVRKEFS